ncbi:uncharacterized protein M421DRAFT_5874 [Didymella exigua CBS 183.55]|uniref:Large ribosomal subunit protein mL67 n=1 Tax=Didymella exigua CBS 183.55 TaxID=1150837 RepID=A0A6A5RIF3_9PLEO|nr:uncharacterized protein M421DRAFT_5874 [Didymella exigua CBS 183.55]KAF1927592.1 hypothetical protein M421DRAFT_5874 [Didymella exigua CBS 183.55]
MPRNLARLRYRLPPAPVSFEGIDAGRVRLLENKVAQYVVRQSNPRHVKLQTVVNAKAKPLPTGKSMVRPIKPYTLRDVVDPEGTARHGQIIYVFRSIKTNQVIYSLQELLDDHHLAQLPFIGKHSVPAQLRPDEWTPHCVIAFATPEQGHNAFRKLREFRKLHEVSWEKTNPGWKQLKIELRIKKIMDQRANMSADLAEVLRIQHAHGLQMATALAEQQQKASEFMDKKWASIDSLANAAAEKEKQAASVKWLEHEIRRLTQKMKMKHMQKDEDQKRLEAARASHEARLRRVQYALRKAEQFKKMQDDLAAKAAPANEAGAQERLDDLHSQVSALRDSLENPDPTRSQEHLDVDADLLERHTAEIATLEEAFEAKQQADSRDHYIARSVLPQVLKKPLPTPYTLEGVSVMWADMQDALYAAGAWPEAIEHETLAINRIRDSTAYLSAEEFEIEKRNEVSRILAALRPEELQETDEDKTQLYSRLEEPEQKTGVLGMLAKVNPFKSASA